MGAPVSFGIIPQFCYFFIQSFAPIIFLDRQPRAKLPRSIGIIGVAQLKVVVAAAEGVPKGASKATLEVKIDENRWVGQKLTGHSAKLEGNIFG